MKKVLCAVVLTALAGEAGAADFGIGVSVQSSDSWLYVPIDITPSFRLEPSLRYLDQDGGSETNQVIFGTTQRVAVESERQNIELALGLFGMKKLGESTRVYYGGRVAYIKSESDFHITQSFLGTVDEQHEETSSDGYRISPTLGVEYLFNEHFSLGAEAEWFYQDIDSDFKTTDDPASAGDSQLTGTDTRLIVRFMF